MTPDTDVPIDAEPEITSEPELTPEPEITGEPDVTPEIYPKSEPEPESELESAWAEPEPDWTSAFSDWGVAWELHVYVFACCYMIIFVLALLSLTYFLKNKPGLKQGKLTVSLLLMLMIFTFLRSFAMFVDPYGTVGIMPGHYFRTFWSLALPGLTASFSVLLLVLLDTTKMSLGPPRFQKLSTILIFTGGHFSIVIVSDIAFSLCDSCKSMLLFCQILFILYGALLSAGYMYSSIAIYKNTAAGNNQDDESKKILRLSKAAAVASAISLVICATHIYDASSEFGIYSVVEYVDAWHWWALQTIKRLEEVFACMLVLVIAFRKPCDRKSHVTTCFGERKTHAETIANVTKETHPAVTSGVIQIT